MPNLLRAALATALVVAGIAAVAPTVANAAAVTINADYNANAGTFDHAKFLNGNEGGYKAHDSLNWLPESYPQFKQAGMRMIVITHLLNENFYNVVESTAPLKLNFDRVDRIIDPLVAQGITPMMQVAFTPQALGGADKALGYNSNVPNNNELWRQVVDGLVRHYAIDKGNSDPRYKGWYWEIWNEPDLRLSPNVPPMFWNGTKAQFNAMYGVTANAVRQVDDTARIGGPGTTHHGWWWYDDDANGQGLSTYLRNNPSVPFDFLSFHHYGPETTFQLVPDAKQRIINANRPNADIFVTEWNYTFENRNAGAESDTNVAASFAARRMADAWRRPDLTKIFWFAPKEGWQPTALFDGDLGMMTIDGHKKAAYNTFALMNKLQTGLMAQPGTGAVGAFATKDPSGSGKVAVLAWNDQAADTDLTLQLSNLPYQSSGKNVRVTQYVVDKVHGNHYQDYAEGLRGWKVAPYENADPVDSRVVAGTAGLSSTVKIRGHGVVLFELEPTTAAPTNVQQLGPTPIPIGSRNLAAARTVSASSAPAFPGWSAGALVDSLTHSFVRTDTGVNSSGWTSNGHPTEAATEWVAVNLGGPVKLNRVKLFPRDDKQCEGYGFPIDFKIQGSLNGAAWADLVTQTNYNGGAPLAKPVAAQTFNVSGEYQHVRVIATKLQRGCAEVSDASKYFQLAELQVESDTNLARTATVSGSPPLQEAGWSPTFANDGVDSSAGSAKGWSSALQATATAAQNLQVTMTAPTMISRVDLVPRDDAGNVGEGFPKTFKVWTATNTGCTDWVQVASRAGHPDPGRFARTVGFQARVAKCVRVEATVLDQLPSGSYAFQLAEVKVAH